MYHVDVVAINDIAKSIEEELWSNQNEINRSGSSHSMKYQVIFFDDFDYDSQVNEAIEAQETMVDLHNNNRIIGKVIFANDDKAQREMKHTLSLIITGVIGVVWLFLCIFIFIIYKRLVQPFQNLQEFARSVAKGDLDFPLRINKRNYFGAFTESFDLMREELKRARQGEYEANRSKKELVAELSHDIKTPIATIKAICELLEVKWSFKEGNIGNDRSKSKEIIPLLDFSKEKMKVIYNKADTIDQLIGNLFHATLEELEMLKIEPIEEGSKIIEQMLRESNHYDKIHLINEIPQCLILCDQLRLSQVLDNIINNSYKYAGTNIDVLFNLTKEAQFLTIKIKDYGLGVEETELPLVCQKFFRGSSDKVRNESGSGLGLYLAKLFMEQMKGTFRCYNEDGFVVEIGVRLA
jgi:signal transduction histidine kinase